MLNFDDDTRYELFHKFSEEVEATDGNAIYVDYVISSDGFDDLMDEIERMVNECK